MNRFSGSVLGWLMARPSWQVIVLAVVAAEALAVLANAFLSVFWLGGPTRGLFRMETVGVSVVSFLMAAGLVLFLRRFATAGSGGAGLRRMIDRWRLMEEALRESEEKYRAAMEAAQDAVFLANTETGIILDANRAAERLMGIPRMKLRGVHQSMLHPPEEAKRYKDIFHTHVRDISSPVEGVVARSDGARVPVEISAFVTVMGGQSVVAGVFRDLTDRRRAEEALLESEERFRTAFRTLPDAVTITRLGDSAIVDANDGFTVMSGYSREEALGRTPLELGLWENPPDMSLLSERLEKEGYVTSFEATFRRKDGNIAHGQVSAVVLVLGGEPHVLSAVRDVTGQDRDRERIHRQLAYLRAVHSIDMAISASLDLPVTLAILIEQLQNQLKVDAAAVFLLDRHAQQLQYAAGKGFLTHGIRRMLLRPGQCAAGKVVLERKPLFISASPKEDPRFCPAGREFLREEGFTGYAAVPLVSKGEVKGVLQLFHRSPLLPDQEWKDFLETVAGQAAIAIDDATLFADLQQAHGRLMAAYDSTIEGWSRALDYRDKETEGHSRRVTEVTLHVALLMGVLEDQLVYVRWGALLHDIGKLGVPDNILLKPGKLTAEEWAVMKRHPVIARDLLAPIEFLRPALDIPLCHHEQWDGQGYPQGLGAEDIPLAARIFSVVDVWDALSSDRPYRPAWPAEKVRAFIAEQSGRMFDPRVVEVFLEAEDIWDGNSPLLARTWRFER
ncbi:MAG: PAS domain S-box protein [Nitrospirota bacterium]